MWLRLPLLVLVYVTLDFANPLMPGAVRFEAGAVESVQADRVARSAIAVAPDPAALRTDGLLPPDAVLRPPLPAPAMSHPARRETRRVSAPRSDPSPSPSPAEEH
jgi:hypothetical protein